MPRPAVSIPVTGGAGSRVTTTATTEANLEAVFDSVDQGRSVATISDLSTVTGADLALGEVIICLDDRIRYERATDDATDAHIDYSGSGGLKLYEAGPNFTTRPRLVAAVARGASWPDGAEISAEGINYRAASGSTQIPDAAGFNVVLTGGAYNARAFGVAADGATNDTNACQAAHDAAAASGAIVEYPAGEYATTGLTITDTTRIEFAPGAVFKALDPGGRASATISGATQANPCVVTATAHGLSTGDRVQISGVSGMDELNGGVFIVTSVDADSFSLDGVNSTNFGAYTSGGTVKECMSVLRCEGSTSPGVTDSGFYSSLAGVRVDANGVSEVIGFDLINFRHTAALERAEALDCAAGFLFARLCWNTVVLAAYAKDCDNGYIVTDGSNAMTLLHAGSDATDAAVPVAGVVVRNGKDFSTVGVNILGGFHQATKRGIDDSASNTKIRDTYFETCSEADVFTSGSFPVVESTHHSANYDAGATPQHGIVCFKGRHSTAATILYPALIGTRLDGLFDFDSTNDFAKARKNETGGTNTDLGGDVTGIAIETLALRVNDDDEVGVNGAPVSGYPFSITLDGGGDVRATDFGSSSAFGTWGSGKAMRWNAPSSHRFFSGTAGAETEQVRIESGIMTLFGQLQAGSLPTFADDAAAGVGGLPSGRIYRTASGELRIKT